MPVIPIRRGAAAPLLFPVVLLLLLVALPARPSVLGVDFQNTPDGIGPSTWNLGYEFLVNDPVVLIALGAFDSPGGWGGTQNVGLWDQNGVLIASAIVTNSDTAIGNWYFASVTPVILNVGEDYVVGAQGGTNYAQRNGAVNVAPDITYVQDRLHPFGSASPLTPLTEPDISEGYTASDAGWFGGNVELAPLPEPAPLWLVALGLLGLAISRAVSTRPARHARACTRWPA